jgi:flagellar M-ring protein FliF
VNSFADFLKTLGPSRIAALGLVAAGLFGFFAFVTIKVTEEPMALLYSELDQQDAAAILAELDAQNIPYELKGDGTRIFVPENRVLRMRMAMAEQGLPNGNIVGYEIFDNADALGTTSFVQNLNYLRALEGEMARTIRSIDRVENARVHLVLPEREVFSRQRREPSASIVLKVRGAPLAQSQVKAIQYLAASGVDGLKPGRVSIVDETGNLLASGDGNETAAALNATFDERNIAYERRLRSEIERIVESIVGPEKARVRVTAELDFNRVTRTSDRYDPDGQVVRSTQTVEESSASSDGVTNEGVTVGNNVPDANFGADNGDTSATATDTSNRVEETVNYEISRVTETEVLEAGRVKRISVAVLVDGVYDLGENGNVNYQSRSPEDLEKIASLVRSAIGFDEERGDQVEVVNLRFAPQSEAERLPEIEEPFLGLKKSDYMRIGEIAALLIISVLVLLFVVRPFIKGLSAPAKTGTNLALPPGTEYTAPDGTQMIAQGTDENGEPIAALPGPQVQRTSDVESMIDIARVEGKVRESSVKKVGELISGHPDETLAIIRNWLHEQPA